MVEPRSVSKVGVTPGKLVLVLVLAVVFVSVLLFQLGAKESPSTLDQSADVAADSDRRPRENSANTSVSPPNNGDVLQQARRWPEITLEEIQQHDPFAFPAVLAPPAAVTASDRSKQRDGSARRAQMQRERKEDLAELCQQGVQMIFLGQDEQVALVGSRQIRVGDVVAGFRVTAIRTDGVVLVEQEQSTK